MLYEGSEPHACCQLVGWWALQRSSECMDYNEPGTDLLLIQRLQSFAQARIHSRQFLHYGLLKNFMGDLLVAVGKDIAQTNDATLWDPRIPRTVSPHPDGRLAQIDEQFLNGETQNSLTDKFSTTQA